MQNGLLGVSITDQQKVSTDRATVWSVTINNPTEDDDVEIAMARQKGWKVMGQKEQGATGTVHYQLMVRTPQVRFSAVKKAFTRGHIEVCRDVHALKAYVVKQDTRVGEIPQSEMYPPMHKVMSWYVSYVSDLTIDSTADEYLERFDIMIRQKIREGYYVEQMAVNPLVRASIKKFGYDIVFREKNKLLSIKHNNGQEQDRSEEGNEEGRASSGTSSDN